jgi:predicted dehydrogenase
MTMGVGTNGQRPHLRRYVLHAGEAAVTRAGDRFEDVAVVDLARTGFVLRRPRTASVPSNSGTSGCTIRGCHLVNRVIDMFGKPLKVTRFLRHESPLKNGLADNGLAVFKHERAIAEVSLTAFQPNGGKYRRLEIVGSNGVARVEPYSPQHDLVRQEALCQACEMLDKSH